jgi:hypothetical protein
VFVTAAFVALWVTDPFSSLTPDGTMQVERLVVFPLAYGALLGRWWGCAFALLPVALLLPADGESAGASAYYVAPWLVATIAFGVGLHKVAIHLARAARTRKSSAGHASGDSRSR